MKTYRVTGPKKQYRFLAKSKKEAEKMFLQKAKEKPIEVERIFMMGTLIFDK